MIFHFYVMQTNKFYLVILVVCIYLLGLCWNYCDVLKVVPIFFHFVDMKLYLIILHVLVPFFHMFCFLWDFIFLVAWCFKYKCTSVHFLFSGKKISFIGTCCKIFPSLMYLLLEKKDKRMFLSLMYDIVNFNNYLLQFFVNFEICRRMCFCFSFCRYVIFLDFLLLMIQDCMQIVL